MLNDKTLVMLNDLKIDNQSGARELINKALNVIKSQLNTITNESLEISEIIVELSRRIIDCRPSMAPLINTIGYLIGSDLKSLTKSSILQKIEQFFQDKNDREKRLEDTFQNFITSNYKNDIKIMLISYSSTIINLLTKLKGNNIELYILESRPLLEGHKTAEDLSSTFKTHLIIDMAMGKFINKMDLVLVGIDSVLKDGAIINKIGTYPLAVLARERGVDTYAMGDSFKYNLKSHYDLKVDIEPKPIEEVYNKQTSSKSLMIHNYYFDITPPNYITGIISELGILRPQKFVKEVIKILPIKWFQSFLNNNQ